MNKERIKRLLEERLSKETILIDEPMSRHTSFKIGGNADFLVQPDSINALQEVVEICKKEKCPFYIVGNGSNLLVDDKGYHGVIIQIYKALGHIKLEGERIEAQAGALLSRIASYAAQKELTGFEFAQGIPGTLGGAVVMNAGAYDGEMKSVLVEATVLNEKGEIQKVSKEELGLGYRTSNVPGNNWIILSATLQLKKGNKEAIEAKMKDFMGRRREKQPLDKPSAGSTFKRPQGHFAGKLIMDAGLRGYQIGGARVSDKHCGFIVNEEGRATCEDVKALIKAIQKIVEEQYGVHLEPEVKLLENE